MLAVQDMNVDLTDRKECSVNLLICSVKNLVSLFSLFYFHALAMVPQNFSTP